MWWHMVAYIEQSYRKHNNAATTKWKSNKQLTTFTHRQDYVVKFLTCDEAIKTIIPPIPLKTITIQCNTTLHGEITLRNIFK